jgi:ribosomal protein S18 acetylase RimI-like enzyme
MLDQMTNIAAEPYAPERFDELAGFLSQNAARRLPGSSVMMPGDLVWRLAGSAPAENLMLFRDANGIAAYAWFEPDTGFEFDLRHDLSTDDPLARAVLAWAADRRRSLPPAYPRFVDLETMDDWAREITHPASQEGETLRWLSTVAFESQPDRTSLLLDAGYRPTRHFSPQFRRSLADPVDVPAVAGRLRAVTAADRDARVAAHRAAWLRSSWDADCYAEIRAAPMYRESLDVVLDVDGEFSGYCLCWADDTSRLGILEPVGTRPERRGTGVGRAVVLEGLRRLREAGMKTAQVGTAGFNTPARALYESCGFVRHDTLRTFITVIE